MTNVLVEAVGGELYRVPDSEDLLPRDYDMALSLPHQVQMAISSSPGNTTWPAMIPAIDPKCIVVVRAKAASNTVVREFFWFVRLSLTPQLLRRIPSAQRETTRNAMLTHPTFKNSSLVVEYVDGGGIFDAKIQGWQRVELLPFAAKQAETQTDVQSQGTCILCMDAPASRIFIPCGHVGLCPACGTKPWRQCPVCRSSVGHINAVFTV